MTDHRREAERFIDFEHPDNAWSDTGEATEQLLVALTHAVLDLSGRLEKDPT